MKATGVDFSAVAIAKAKERVAGQRAYVSELARLLAPRATQLIWALDESPSGLALTPEGVKPVFAPAFELTQAWKSRRRLARSHWYWLIAIPKGRVPIPAGLRVNTAGADQNRCLTPSPS